MGYKKTSFLSPLFSFCSSFDLIKGYAAHETESNFLASPASRLVKTAICVVL